MKKWYSAGLASIDDGHGHAVYMASDVDAKLKEYEEDNTGLSEAASRLCARIDREEGVNTALRERIVVLTKALRDLRIELMHNAALPDHQEWVDAFEIINKSLAE